MHMAGPMTARVTTRQVDPTAHVVRLTTRVVGMPDGPAGLVNRTSNTTVGTSESTPAPTGGTDVDSRAVRVFSKHVDGPHQSVFIPNE